MSKKLFVGNLPFDVNDADLKTVLSVAGTVVEARIVLNKKTGRSKGYGFVEMETEALALEAVKKFEGATLNERALTVQLATAKEEAAKDEATPGEAGPSESAPA
jgi:RNA recognition motif-containing protein